MLKFRQLGLAVSTLALTASLVGCGAQALPTASVKRIAVEQGVQLSPTTGAVAVRFAGLPAYHTLATTQDIASVRLTLSGLLPVDPPVYCMPHPMPSLRPLDAASASGTAIAMPICRAPYHQVITLGAAALHQSQVNANFNTVPPQPVSLLVEALDAQGNVIGSGNTTGQVVAGKVTNLSLDVRLLPTMPQTGGVSATVTFLNSPMIM